MAVDGDDRNAALRPAAARAALPGERLFTPCDASRFGFATTAELDGIGDVSVQSRVLEAIGFGIDIDDEGYNLFVMGPTGIGKHSLTHRLVSEKAKSDPVPRDWCYVHNFKEPDRPAAIALPPGRGAELRDAMGRLVEDLRGAIGAAFESEEFQRRLQEVEEEFKERQEKALEQLSGEAEGEGMRLLRTPAGFAFAPVRDKEVIAPDEFARMPPEEQQAITKKIEALQSRMQELMRGMQQIAKESRDKVRALTRQVALAAVEHSIVEVKARFADEPRVVAHLDAVQADVLDNIDQFRRTPDDPQAAAMMMGAREAPPLDRYRVNLIVDHAGADSAPVVTEEHPTYQNLIGRVEQKAQLGALLTDFTLIKPGALHEANGGYLLLDAHKVLVQPFAWDALKMALESRFIRIESLGQMLSLVSTVSLQPEHIPLDVKVILLGDRFLYYLLYNADPDFKKLFKVSADFEERMDRDPQSDDVYARLIAAVARKHELRPFDPGAVARVIEEAARAIGDSEKISTHVGDLRALLAESSYWAGEAGREVVTAADVQTAVDMKVRRVDRMKRRVQEEIRRETILIQTDGERVAQINGLSVLDVGELRFGQPSRITATASVGRGNVLNIEREVKLSGPFHSKGVLILAAFLASRYAREKPLSLSASLVFEQSYGPIDGDSASLAETCALLSALSEVPLRQSFAVTGSISQHGDVQPIGGVNEKIEGFFDACRDRGLTGSQGVVIPDANVKHLMLRRDVVEAATTGRFAVYAVRTVDEAIELLTGVEVGERDDTGTFPADTLNGKVQRRLEALYRKRRALVAEASAAAAGVLAQSAESDASDES